MGKDFGDLPVIQDKRFAKVHSDPRFTRQPKKERKVRVDDRFKSMFTNQKFSTTPKYDKKGRKIHQDASEVDPGLSELYSLGSDSEHEDEPQAQEQPQSSNESDEEQLDASKQDNDNDDADTSSDTSESCFSDSLSDGAEEGDSEPEEAIPTTDPTNRLAVMNLDWQQLRSVDILAVLQSFCPSGGIIEKVTVYPSQFGLEQMQKEALEGPQVFESKPTNDDNEDEGTGVDERKLRKYEKQRLRYYFAVVECNSVACAEAIYTSCDGIEFERSSNFMDIRFIPDGTEIPTDPRDTATDVPEDYEPPDFNTRVNQHTKVELSWDKDDPKRSKLKKKLTAEELREDHLRAFLASSSDEEDHGTDADKLRGLLLGGLDGDGPKGDEDDDGVQGDLEVTFSSKYEELGNIMKKKAKAKKENEVFNGEETTWEKHLREAREKRKKKRFEKKQQQTEEQKGKSTENGGDDAADLDDPFFTVGDDEAGAHAEEDADEIGPTTNRKKQAKKEKENAEKLAEKQRQEQEKAELELLMMDESAPKKGYDLKRLIEPSDDKVCVCVRDFVTFDDFVSSAAQEKEKGSQREARRSASR
eukprot:c4965_g1_i2.p1 GENE.c4965_g1_i2~~c4965_g1_i2.p1  ORF type:complete len:586 (-),score=173.14 c4965_g1_i2:400-2157(-)